jgi:hypothetical protein
MDEIFSCFAACPFQFGITLSFSNGCPVILYPPKPFAVLRFSGKLKNQLKLIHTIIFKY